MVKVKWMPFAIKNLKDICQYYRYDKQSPQTSKAIKEELIYTSRILESFPEAGAIEPSLENLPVRFRYLVARKHYKLIYFVEKDLVSIVAVWDCRQAPETLKKKIK